MIFIPCCILLPTGEKLLTGQIKEKVPGKLITAGILMMVNSALTLLFLLFILTVPLLISPLIGFPISSMADMLAGEMNTMKGSANPSPLTMTVFGLIVFILLTALIIYESSLMANGFGIVRGRLTKKPPYNLAYISFLTVLIPPWGGILFILKILTGIFMIIAFKDEKVKALYERARDPNWEANIPPVLPLSVPPPHLPAGQEPVRAMVLE
jgi:hypothetical protein